MPKNKSFKGQDKSFVKNKTRQKIKKTIFKSKNHCTYQLNLENGKKYIGKSSQTAKRIKDHFAGKGSSMTRKNKPISVDYVHKHSTEKKQADAETREYYIAVDKYGKQNVRGAGNTKAI